MRFVAHALIAGSLCVLASCAAIGPTDVQEFPRLVAQAVPQEDGEVLLSGTGNWYPNMRGFTGLRSSMLSKPADPIPGVLVVAANAISFQQWDPQANAFDTVKRVKFDAM